MPGVLVYFLCVAVGAFGGALLAAILVPAGLPAPYAWLIRATTVMAIVLGITQAFLKRSKRRWSDFGVGTGRSGRATLRGAAGGLLLGLSWLAVIAWLSPFGLTWNQHGVPSKFIAASLGTVAMGIAEEVGYRSYGLLEVRRRKGYVAAVALSCAIFVAAHVAGGVPWAAALLVVGSSSVLFCVVMLETGKLPLVVALHVATNLVQDNTLRGTPDASLFLAHASASSPTPGTELAIWMAMALINLGAAAGVLAWCRRGASTS